MSNHAPVTIDELLPALIVFVKENKEHKAQLKKWEAKLLSVKHEKDAPPRPVKPMGPVFTGEVMLEILNEIIGMRGHKHD